ncbi:MAG: PAS domain S-box protein [Desmonostoc vinosum HA7617-LM4]|jgi:PAS domain S-box-containing protein|nr:PAS domain S-box protein [Desmonostoc vinosum HA7617-LM4]
MDKLAQQIEIVKQQIAELYQYAHSQLLQHHPQSALILEENCEKLRTTLAELQATEEAQRQREEHYRIICDLTSDYTYVYQVGTNGTLVPKLINDAFTRVCGYTIEDVSARGWQSLIYRDDVPFVLQHVRQLLSGQPDVFEHRIITKSGEVRWVRNYAYPLLSQGHENVLYVYGAAQDITERKRTEERLRLLESVVVNAHDAIIITEAEPMDEPGPRILYVNEAFTRITGYSAQEVLGKNPRILQGPNTQRDALNKICSALKRWESVEVELINYCQDGSQFWAELSIVPVSDETGWYTHWIAVQRDISDRKQAELERAELLEREQVARTQAEEANRVKDEFLAVLSHELRSPLNPILGWAKLLQSRKLDEKKTAEAIATIERNAKLQIQLIDDLLDVSRILRGKLSLNISPVNLVFIIEAAIETVRVAAIAKSIQIQTVFDQPNRQGKVTVAGDPNRLQQIVWNLLSNAIKFTPVGGRVEVKLEKVGEMGQIIISDTGKGISTEFLPYVFDRFRQADASTTRMYGGLGLGLAIVRYLTELHGGTVNATSPGEDQGATFALMLPLLHIESEINEEDELVDSEPDLTQVRVLVVEDTTDSREFLVFLLEQYGAITASAESAAEAFEAVQQFRPDVIVSDIGMPIEDGYSLIRRVRNLKPEQGGNIPAIALTAYAKNEDRDRAMAAGFQKHLPKPIQPEELTAAIASLKGVGSGE